MDKKNQFPQSAEVDAFRQHILKTAEEMVVNKFPKRIVQLNKMITSGKLTSSPSSVYQKINIPVPDCTESSSTTASQTQAAANAAATKQSGASSTTGTTAAQSSGVSSNGETGVSANLQLNIRQLLVGWTKTSLLTNLMFYFLLTLPAECCKAPFCPVPCPPG